MICSTNVLIIMIAAPYYTSVLYYVLATNRVQQGDGAERIFQVIFFFGELIDAYLNIPWLFDLRSLYDYAN